MDSSDAHIIARQSKSPKPRDARVAFTQLPWRWPWYAIAFAAVLIVGTTGTLEIRIIGLCTFTIIAVLVTLAEKMPDVVVLPVGLATWTIVQIQWEVWQEVLVFSCLCLLIFCFQFIWGENAIKPVRYWRSKSTLPNILALGGQTLVVLIVAFRYLGSLAQYVMIAQTGAIGIFILALLVLLFGYTQEKKKKSIKYWSTYGAGLLISLIPSWELLALVQSPPRIDVLIVPPASYLTVIAPLLVGNKNVHGSHLTGNIISAVGPSILLGSSLLLSFFQTTQGSFGAIPNDLLSLLLLLVESLGLCFLGIFWRPQIPHFIYGGIVLLILAVLRLLFDALAYGRTYVLVILAGVGVVILIGTTIGAIIRRRRRGRP